MKIISRIKTFIAELKNRKVFHVGSFYLITAWGASLGAAELFPAFGIPDWGVRAIVITAMLGFPIALVLAWAFEITNDGVVLDPGRKDPATAEPSPTGIPAGTTTWLQGAVVLAQWVDNDQQHSREFNNDFVIGRDPNADIQLSDNKVSRNHAKVSYESGMWWISDMASRNGTKLNGKITTGRVSLEDTNKIQLYDGEAPILLSIGKPADKTVLD